MKKTNTPWYAALLAAAVITGCTKEEATAPTPPPPPSGSGSIKLTPAPSAATTTTEAPKAPVMEEKPVLETSNGGAGMASDGLPNQGVDGRKLNDTIARLMYAVDYYNQSVAGMKGIGATEEEQKRMKPYEVPPLERLEQLVEKKIIRAIPEGPAGKKYVYDAKENKVKLVNK